VEYILLSARNLTMQTPNIPQDDLLDVMEMTKKIENFISKTLKDNELSLSVSALMSATINSMLALCSTLDEVVFYRNLFIQVFDSSIRNINIKKK
jgi:hypothetical protein